MGSYVTYRCDECGDVGHPRWSSSQPIIRNFSGCFDKDSNDNACFGVNVGTLFLLLEQTMVDSYFLLATPARAFDVPTQALS